VLSLPKIDPPQHNNQMPLIKTVWQGTESAVALWRIEEPEEELAFLALESCPDDIVHMPKRLEWLAARALTAQLVLDIGLEYAGLRKDEFGKPFLKGLPHQLALTHSFPYVAVQIDAIQSVGIDLEQPKEKLRTVAPRMFTPGETEDAGDNLTKLCIYWCAKEALYKLHGKRSLLFSEHLLVQPFLMGNKGALTGIIQGDEASRQIKLGYEVTPDFVWVYTDTSRP
jgi:hypothetical protein